MAQQNIHSQVVGLLAMLEGKESAYSLLEYLSQEARQTVNSVLDHLSNLPDASLQETIAPRLKALRSQETFSGIAEIHPAWLMEALEKESPRVIGVILRHLPSKHVRYLLEHLPRRIVMKLPKLIEAFYVPTEILTLIRRRFERHFVPMCLSHQIDPMEFKHLYYLKTEELDCLFRELGLSELALSLVGSTRQILKVIVNRFNIRDAKDILNKIKRFHDSEKWMLKDAKFSILELNGRELGADCFLKELGLLSLVKAFDSSDWSLFEVLKQKLAPEDAYLLKRSLDEQVLRFNSVWTARRKEWIMSQLLHLSEEGKIDSMWSGALKREAA